MVSHNSDSAVSSELLWPNLTLLPWAAQQVKAVCSATGCIFVKRQFKDWNMWKLLEGNLKTLEHCSIVGDMLAVLTCRQSQQCMCQLMPVESHFTLKRRYMAQFGHNYLFLDIVKLQLWTLMKNSIIWDYGLEVGELMNTMLIKFPEQDCRNSL